MSFLSCLTFVDVTTLPATVTVGAAANSSENLSSKVLPLTTVTLDTVGATLSFAPLVNVVDTGFGEIKLFA